MTDSIRRAASRGIVVAALTFVFAFLSGCGSADFSTWKTYSPDDGSFTVSVPGTLVHERRMSKFASGDLETDVYALDFPDGGFVTITDTVVPLGMNARDGAGAIVDNSVDRIIASASGQQVYNRGVVVAGYAGREIELDLPTAVVETGGRLRARVFVAGTHLFELICVVPNRLSANDELNHFLDSFALRQAR